MPAQLLALTDGPNLVLDKPILLIGRHPECDIQIESRKISRRHCIIAQVANYLVIRDLDSTNGIRINGERKLEGRLQSGDELTIGNHRYRVTWNDLPDHPPARMLRRELADPLAPNDVQDDDEVLESCDEPIPLSEDSPGGPAAVGKPVCPPVEVRPESPPHISLPSEPFILPDEFRLLPGSSDVGPAAQGSGSHH